MSNGLSNTHGLRTSRRLHRGAGAFTLLEVMLAVGIIGLISIGIYRFVDSTLRVVQSISLNAGGDEEIESLCRVIQYQLNDIPLEEKGVILGQPHIFGGKTQDELQWRCSAGNGLFTAFAPGDYWVTLRVQSVPSQGGASPGMALGIRRVPSETRNPNDFNWLPLIGGVTGMEVRYWHPGLNGWQDKWTDRNLRPSLIRLKFWRESQEEPFEVTLVSNGKGGRK